MWARDHFNGRTRLLPPSKPGFFSPLLSPPPHTRTQERRERKVEIRSMPLLLDPHMRTPPPPLVLLPHPSSLPLCLLFICVLPLVPGIFSAKVVTLDSIQIFTTHEWLTLKPTVYFRCKGENMTVLPDVKETYIVYAFKGQESWQPITELPDKKCKRCGFYEKDTIDSDDTFDEWEFCPGDFVNAKYMRFKEKEFNATFSCPQCAISEDSISEASNSTDVSVRKKNHHSLILLVTICTVASTIFFGGVVAGYLYWQKKKRENDQARFLKIFQEGEEELEDLGLRDVL